MQELFIGQAPDIPEPLLPTSNADIAMRLTGPDIGFNAS